MLKKYILTLIIFFILFISAENVSAKVEGHLWLVPPDGSYNEENDDPWISESYLITENDFELEIYNKDPNDGGVSELYLIITVNMDPNSNSISVVLDEEDNYDSCKSTVQEWDLVDENQNEPTVCGYKYPPHGIFLENGNTYYLIKKVHILDDPRKEGIGDTNGVLEYEEMTKVHVHITSNNQQAKVHFDAVGCDQCVAKEFVPPSHDVTQLVPEFTTIAIPAILIVALLFFLRNRN